MQFVQVMTDKMGTCPPNMLPQECGFFGGAYFSCANVLINGTIPPSSLSPTYTSLDGQTTQHTWGHEPGVWQGPDANNYYYDPVINSGVTASSSSQLKISVAFLAFLCFFLFTAW